MQWYPGHMAKAKKEIQEKLGLVDIVYELIDARIPYSSRNPMINEILKSKERLIIITKSTLADNIETARWQAYFKSQNIPSLVIDSVSGFNVNKIVSTSKTILEEKFLKEKKKGLKPRSIRAMVLGIPNVGKSTLINKLVNKKVSNVGNRPGVTVAQQWIRIHKDLDLLDTPGVLWPKFEDPKVGMHLALTGAIKDEVLKNKEDMIEYLLNFLKQYYPKELTNRYNIDINQNNQAIIMEIGKARGNIKNNEVEYEVVIDAILHEFKNAKIGRITLDRLDNE